MPEPPGETFTIYICLLGKITKTRMHSSRMRTVRNSSRLLGPGGSGGGIPACTEADPHCGQRDRCKNITFATSLRTVIRCVSLIRLSRGLSGIFVFFPCKLTTNSLILMTNNSIVVIRILSIDSILNVRMLSIMQFRNVQ